MEKTKNMLKILASWVGIILISFILHVLVHPLHLPSIGRLIIQDSIFVLYIWLINRQWFHQQFRFQKDFDFRNNVLLLTVVLAYNIYLLKVVSMTLSLKHFNLLKLFFPALIIGLCAGIAEELIFRGLIFTYLQTHVTNNKVIPAALISSLLFGLTHYINLSAQTFSMTTVQVINAFALGMVFVAIYVRTKNLLFPMFLHFLNDFIAYFASGGVAVEKLPHIAGFTPQIVLIITLISVIIKSIIMIIVALAWMRKSKVNF